RPAPSNAAVPAHRRLLGDRDAGAFGFRHHGLALDDRRHGAAAHRSRGHALARRCRRPRRGRRCAAAGRHGAGRHCRRCRCRCRCGCGCGCGCRCRANACSRTGARAMNLRNSREHWGHVSQAFHWLIVLLILVLAIVGLTMGELPRTPKYFWVYTAHKSLGITVLALMLARLGWRLYAGAPAPVAGTPGWQVAIANLTHWLLYALVLAMPLSGWLYDSACGLRPVR